MLEDFSDVLVPLIIPAKGGGTQAVRAVLTSSDEDKDLLKVNVTGDSDCSGFVHFIKLWF